MTTCKPDLTKEKTLTDCYEFLHLLEMGRGSMEELMEVFGDVTNKAESNYRQVERIKRRCIELGINVTYDEVTAKFTVPLNSKFLLLEKAEKQLEEARRPKPTLFGRFSFLKEVR